MPLARDNTRSNAFALHELERHQRRRKQGIPTLSVLTGPPGGTMSLWRNWLDSRHQALCVSRDVSEAKVIREWTAVLTRSRNLEADAADFLGTAAGLPRASCSHV